MIAKLEGDIINVYNKKNQLIGGVKTQSNFKNAEIIIDGKSINLSRNKWETTVIRDGNVIYHLKTNSNSGNIKITETGQKITGVIGLKWGTKLVDKDNITLLKIRNENPYVNRNRYEIEISNEKTSDLDILLTLYGHLYGSNMKLKAVLTIAFAVIVTNIILRLFYK